MDVAAALDPPLGLAHTVTIIAPIAFTKYSYNFVHLSLRKKGSFPLRISSFFVLYFNITNRVVWRKII